MISNRFMVLLLVVMWKLMTLFTKKPSKPSRQAKENWLKKSRNKAIPDGNQLEIRQRQQ